jgi:hypothetical protein
MRIRDCCCAIGGSGEGARTTASSSNRTVLRVFSAISTNVNIMAAGNAAQQNPLAAPKRKPKAAFSPRPVTNPIANAPIRPAMIVAAMIKTREHNPDKPITKRRKSLMVPPALTATCSGNLVHYFESIYRSEQFIAGIPRPLSRLARRQSDVMCHRACGRRARRHGRRGAPIRSGARRGRQYAARQSR